MDSWNGRRRWLPVSLLALLGLAARQGEQGGEVELELTYLANEGFLVRAGETKLLIDAFVPEPYGEYAGVPETLHADMLAGKPPFDGIDLALASHFHRDHFQAPSAAEFLSTRATTPFLSAPDVVDMLRAELSGDAALERVRELLPDAQKTLEFQEGGIEVELLRLPHGVTDNGVQNLGHVIELGGVRLLHVGDSDVRAPDVAGYGLQSRAIDVAFLPYWWLLDAESVRLSRERTGAKHIVAVHVPPRDVAELKTRLAALDPEILLFERQGEARTLRLEE